MGKVIVSLICAVLMSSCGRVTEKPAGSPSSLQAYLPSSEGLGAWKASGEPQVIRGEDLYVYMDGAAAIYHEYGFNQLLVQDYSGPNESSVSLEIYEMADPGAAYGIFTFKSSLRGGRIHLGQEGSLEDYYLNFWKGPFLITLTGLDGGEEAVQELVRLGQLVDAKIKREAPPPSLAKLLPEKDLLGSSLKYFRGPLGLYQNYPFATTNAFDLREGVKADYAPGYSFYVLRYETPERALKAFAAAARSLERDPRFKNFELAAGKAASLEDGQGRRLALRAFRRLILILVGRLSAESAAEIFDRYETDFLDR